jgi:hypothetical protein
MLPFKYIGAIMLGNGLSGISTNVLECICLLSFPPEDQFQSTLVYFILSAVILMACAVGTVVISKNKFFNYYINKSTKEETKSVRRMSGVFEDGKGLLDREEGRLNKTSDNTEKMEVEVKQQLTEF